MKQSELDARLKLKALALKEREIAAQELAAQKARLEKGETGDTGATGPQGATGARGAAGQPGPKGDRGSVGPQGDTGPQGKKGDRGANGPIGPAGRDGLTGPQGPPGSEGPQGKPGIVWKGPYSSGTRYMKGDAVEHEGSSWIATVETTGRPGTGNWDLVAKAGAGATSVIGGGWSTSSSGGGGGGTVDAGAGLTKTGDTLDVVANADGSIVVNANDIQVGALATDAQHGNRGGGALHATADESTSGFLSTLAQRVAGIKTFVARVALETDLRFADLTVQSSAGITPAAVAATYLTQANAASTYLTQANAASTYLTQAAGETSSHAAATYQTIALAETASHAASTYQTIAIAETASHAAATYQTIALAETASHATATFMPKAGGAFSGAVTSSSTITASNLSGTNTGDVTLGTANGLSLASQTLSLAAAIAGGANGALLGTDKTKLDNTSGTNSGDVTIGTANGLSLAGQAISLAAAIAGGANGALLGADKTKLDALSGTNSGDVTLAAIGSVPSNNGASLSGQVLTLQPADATHGGVVTTGTQTIAGAKTFSGAITASNLSGTNTGDVTIGTANGLSLAGQAVSLATAIAGGANGALLGTDKTKLDNTSGTNSGDITLGSVGSSPAAAGASLSGQVLTLQPASATQPGVVSTTTQTIAGDKTISGNIAATNLSGTNTGDITLATVGSTPANAGASLSGQVLTLQPADATHAGVVSTTTQTIAGNKTLSGSLTSTLASGNALVIDSTTLVADATNHRVGVGTASPSAFLHVSNTLPTDTVSTANGVSFNLASSSGGTGHGQTGLNLALTSGYTGAFASQTMLAVNTVAGTANSLSNNNSNFGFRGQAQGVGNANVGAFGAAYNGTDLNVGVYGQSFSVVNSGTNVAVLGQGLNTGTSSKQIGGYFLLSGGAGTDPGNYTSAALIADNGGTTSPILLARDNGTAVLTVADGGAVTATGAVALTAASGNSLVVDTTTLVVDATNHRVGIGTASPSYVLDLVAPAVAATAESVQRWRVADDSASFLEVFNNTSGNARFDPTIRAESTNVSTAAALQVLGQVSPSNDTGSSVIVAFQARRNDASAITTRPLFTFNNFSTQLLTISAAGRVGINNAAASSMLEVTGETISTQATEYVSAVNVGGSFTKNDSNSRIFNVSQIKPTLNFGASNGSTTLKLLNINTVNTSVTGISTAYLIHAAYGDSAKFAVDSGGNADVVGRFNVGQAVGTVANAQGTSISLQSAALDGTQSSTIAGSTYAASFTKNNSVARTYYAHRFQNTINLGGSNTNQTIKIFDIDTTNTSLTGLVTCTLFRLGYGGSDRVVVDSTGATTFAGAVTHGAASIYKGTTGITAFATGGQGSATALTAEVNFVTTVASAADSVKLPTPALGARVVVFNTGANACDIFPVSGGAIDALGTNAAYSLAAGASREFWGQSATAWLSR